jgi:hypothetical protein
VLAVGPSFAGSDPAEDDVVRFYMLKNLAENDKNTSWEKFTAISPSFSLLRY